MNNKELEDLFYTVPNDVDYTDLLEEVDLEDIPEETIEKLTSLLDSDDDFLRYKSSRLLTIWGIKEGFNILTQMFVEGKLEGYIPHRLYSYDDTNRIILDALTSSEYIPYLKHFLSTIMDKPEDNYWRIHDTLKLFLKVEPDYVTQLLKEKQKSLGDFGIEDKGERN